MTTYQEMQQELNFGTYEEFANWSDFYEPGRPAPQPDATVPEHEASAMRQQRAQGN